MSGNGVFMLQASRAVAIRASIRAEVQARVKDESQTGKRQALVLRRAAYTLIDLDPLCERTWRLLRIRKKLSTAEAVGLLCDGKDDAKALRRATGLVSRYLRILCAAEYLRELPSKNPRAGKRYVLVRDTGPGAPFVRVRGALMDPNEGVHYAFVA